MDLDLAFAALLVALKQNRSDHFIEYRVSSFKRRDVYLILGLLGAVIIRGQCLFQKSK